MTAPRYPLGLEWGRGTEKDYTDLWLLSTVQGVRTLMLLCAHLAKAIERP
jgi:hypothetical protein